MCILKSVATGAEPQAERTACLEKANLLNDYDTAAAEFSRTVRVLNQKMGVMSKEEYVRILRFSEQARIRSEQARLALERHVAEHGC